jgi:hypothetical protein
MEKLLLLLLLLLSQNFSQGNQSNLTDLIKNLNTSQNIIQQQNNLTTNQQKTLENQTPINERSNNTPNTIITLDQEEKNQKPKICSGDLREISKINFDPLPEDRNKNGIDILYANPINNFIYSLFSAYEYGKAGASNPKLVFSTIDVSNRSIINSTILEKDYSAISFNYTTPIFYNNNNYVFITANKFSFISGKFTREEYLFTLDISSPNNPKILNRLKLSTYITPYSSYLGTKSSFNNGYIYFITKEGKASTQDIKYNLTIIDVTNPYNTQITKKITLDELEVVKPPFYEELDINIKTSSNGKFLYIIGAPKNKYNDRLLIVFNIENPTDPIKVYESILEKPNLNIEIKPSYQISDRVFSFIEENDFIYILRQITVSKIEYKEDETANIDIKSKNYYLTTLKVENNQIRSINQLNLDSKINAEDSINEKLTKLHSCLYILSSKYTGETGETLKKEKRITIIDISNPSTPKIKNSKDIKSNRLGFGGFLNSDNKNLYLILNNQIEFERNRNDLESRPRIKNYPDNTLIIYSP